MQETFTIEIARARTWDGREGATSSNFNQRVYRAVKTENRKWDPSAMRASTDVWSNGYY